MPTDPALIGPAPPQPVTPSPEPEPPLNEILMEAMPKMEAAATADVLSEPAAEPAVPAAATRQERPAAGKEAGDAATTLSEIVVGESVARKLTAPVPASPAAAATDDVVAVTAQAAITTTVPVEEIPSPGRYALNLHSDPAPIEFLPELGADDDSQLLYVTETQVDGETWYRLRLGFFGTEEEAQARLDDWLADYPNAWLVRVGPRERASATEPQAVASASR